MAGWGGSLRLLASGKPTTLSFLRTFSKCVHWPCLYCSGPVLRAVGILLSGNPSQPAPKYPEPTAAEDISSLDLCQTTFYLIPVFTLLRGVVASAERPAGPPKIRQIMIRNSQWDTISPSCMPHEGQATNRVTGSNGNDQNQALTVASGFHRLLPVSILTLLSLSMPLSIYPYIYPYIHIPTYLLHIFF